MTQLLPDVGHRHGELSTATTNTDTNTTTNTTDNKKSITKTPTIPALPNLDQKQLEHLHRPLRRRPTYQHRLLTPQTYLQAARLHLLQNLPANHRLSARTNRRGRLHPPTHQSYPPDLPRSPFTEEQLTQLRLRRRTAQDPEDVRFQLQDSNLVAMWNGEYEGEEQWREYERAKKVMEWKREVAGIEGGRFDGDEVVGERRRRSIGGTVESVVAVKRSVVDWSFLKDREDGDEDGDEELEDGEVKEEEGDSRPLSLAERLNPDLNDMEALAKATAILKAHNDRTSEMFRRRIAGWATESKKAASPKSSESSGNVSRESKEAVYEFRVCDSEEDKGHKAHEKGVDNGISLAVDSGLEDTEIASKDVSQRQLTSKKRRRSHSGHDLG